MSSNEHNPMEHWPGENISDAPTYGKITLVTNIIIFSVLMFMALSYLYDQWYSTRSRSNHRPTMFFFATTDPSHTASRGLDPAVLKSIPVFAFSNVTHKDPIECAVCLSEFEEGESGRVLPGCEHAFHVECIDMWFHSHSTCPLCRSLVEEPHATTTVEEEEQVTIIAISPAMPLDDLGREPAGTETTRRSFEDNLTRNHSLSSSCQVVMNESDIERGGEEIKSDSRHVDVP